MNGFDAAAGRPWREVEGQPADLCPTVYHCLGIDPDTLSAEKGREMVSPQLLEALRCPLDPGQTRLEDAGDALVCQRCRVRFAVKEGIPSLVPEDAELPPGCPNLSSLPCQRRGTNS